LGVEHQAGEISLQSRLAVKWIAYDGMPEMVKMNPYLVAPTRTRVGFEERVRAEALDDAEVGDAGLAPLGIDGDATRAALAQWLLDRAAILSDHAVDERQVRLLNLSGLELLVEKAMGLRVAGEDDHAAGVLVDPVDDEELLLPLGLKRFQQRITLRAPLRNRRQGLGLVDRDDIRILK
jgi:hypothetical protein